MTAGRTRQLTSWGLDNERGEHWGQRAACVNPDYDPLWWDVPAPTEVVNRQTVIDRANGALNICAKCPVKMACNEDAGRHRPIAQIRAGKIYGHRGEIRDPEWLGIQRTPMSPMSARKRQVKLMPHLGEIMALREVGVSYADIAELYGSSKDSVKSFINLQRRRRLEAA